MSPIYESEEITRDGLFEFRKINRCVVCKGMLNVFLDMKTHKAYLACNSDQSHEGIERVVEPHGIETLNIETRREIMVEELGKEKATKLERHEGVVSLTRADAMEILKTIWPQAPEIEVLKAAIICHQYGLNPLMRHIFLIPFKKRKDGKVVGEDWAVVQGIGSNRLIARRKHNYSYLDMTPRRMTEEEQEKINGEVDDTKIWALTHLRDMETGAEVTGVGSWPIDEVPYGIEKGNTKLNMANIRSEREALDRLYPADMPHGVEVMEEKYIDAKYTLIAEGAGVKTVPGEEVKKVGLVQKAENTTSGAPPAEPKVKRDPETIKTIQDLYKACHEDWGMQPKDVLRELGVSSQTDLTDSPSNCYQQISAVRT